MAGDAVEKVAARQWGWAVAAVVTMVPGLFIGLPSLLAGYFVMTAIPVVVPLTQLRAPRLFARCCLVIGIVLLGWSLVAALLGMILFLPAAVLLLIAAFADGRNRPGARFVLGGGGAAAALMVLVGLGLYMPGGTGTNAGHPPPHPGTYYRVTVDSSARFREPRFRRGVDELKTYRATLTQTFTWQDRSYLTVDYRADANHVWIRKKIEKLPGVTEVRLCASLACEEKGPGTPSGSRRSGG
ncbi:hypothetical protein ACGFYU_33980 [Streptomyces sp. NPDC048337]|uniref:hypothetical protein n=1 Tax=Streptomyces sp. NPDC048337 TaxID=3365535 RepID=UPI0037104C6A